MVHRIASSTLYSSSLYEIQYLWTLDDVLDAIMVLDAYSVANESP